MALTYTYNLEDVVCAGGTFHVNMYSNQNFTAPSINTIVSMGELNEAADDSPGIQDVGTLKLVFREDYTNYDAGFWYKIFEQETWIEIIQDVGGTDYDFFFGYIVPESIVWETKYEDDSSTVTTRIATVELYSITTKLLLTDTQDWITKVIANKISAGMGSAFHTPEYVISVRGFLSSLLETSGLNSSYVATDTELISEQPDIYYSVADDDTVYDLNDLFIVYSIYNDVGAGVVSRYFNSSYSDYLPTLFNKSSELLGAVLRNFGVIARLRYDHILSKFKLDLYHRGRNYADDSGDVILDGEVTGKTIYSCSDLLLDSVSATMIYDSTHLAWYSKKWTGSTVNTAAVPDYITVDLDIQLIWRASYAAEEALFYNTLGRALLVDVAGTPSYKQIETVTYYNYYAGSNTSSTDDDNMAICVGGYFFWRFAEKYKKFVMRYSAMTGTVNGTWGIDQVHIMTRQYVPDVLTAYYCSAYRVKKFPESNELEIEWIEE